MKKHVREPGWLKEDMAMWRRGFRPMPQGYIDHHVEIAKDELLLLQARWGFNILKKQLVNDGCLGDGFRTTEAIVETANRGYLMRIRYQDDNGKFLKRTPSGGWMLIQDDDWN